MPRLSLDQGTGRIVSDDGGFTYDLRPAFERQLNAIEQLRGRGTISEGREGDFRIPMPYQGRVPMGSERFYQPALWTRGQFEQAYRKSLGPLGQTASSYLPEVGGIWENVLNYLIGKGPEWGKSVPFTPWGSTPGAQFTTSLPGAAPPPGGPSIPGPGEVPPPPDAPPGGRNTPPGPMDPRLRERGRLSSLVRAGREVEDDMQSRFPRKRGGSRDGRFVY